MSDLDTIKVVNISTGKEFTNWESVTISSEFLTPCDSFQLEAGAEVAGPDLAKEIATFPRDGNGAAIQILVNDKVQFTGFVDTVEVSCDRGGSKVSVSGRDILAPIVSGNIDPNMSVPKETTLAGLVELVVFKQFSKSYVIFESDIASDIAIGAKSGKKKKYESRHKRDLTIKDIKPHANEGAFTYLSRILQHYGYWLWASQDGKGVVIGGPDYEQPPSYTLARYHDPGSASGKGAGNNILRGALRQSETDVPSHVFVLGVAAGSAQKAAIKGMASNPFVTNFVPAYITDRDATSKEQAERIARLFLAKKMRNFLAYQCTVAGFSDRSNGNVYNTNAVASVHDEKTGTDGNMWVESRTFRKSRSAGSTTDLKLIPLNTLVLDWQAEESIKTVETYPDAAKDVGKKAPGKTGTWAIGDVSYWQSQG